MKSLGICLGASTITFVIVNRSSEIQLEKIISLPHNGDAKNTFLKGLTEIEPNQFDKIAVTGRKFRQNVNLTTLTEPEACEISLSHMNMENNKYNALVSAGGETTIIYQLDATNSICNVFTGNKCASGTGEFFLQQIKRMDLNVEDACQLGKNEFPHKISGRCSVFCKSDCTHALNRGEKKGRVVAGLSQMIAGKIDELLNQLDNKNIILIGGVSKNELVVDYLKQQVDSLLIPDEATYFEALGASLWALQNETKPFSGIDKVYKEGKTSFDFLPPLQKYMNKVTFNQTEPGDINSNDEYIIGLDVGSTTTKAVLLNTKNDTIASSIYLRTNGNPVQASRNCYAALAKNIKNIELNIIGLGVTGSGRQIAGLHALTDDIINEIICHAAASVFFDPEVDTIFEIGGQDAKYTFITDAVPSDYAMNEACSAGTGSFLEESAWETLGIKMEDIGDIALEANNPPNFNDQCAAFISSDIIVASQEGIPHEDIVSGLVYSVCMNYNNRVKGNRAVGNKVFMQGGVCYNKAVPVAMAALTEKQIIVPPDPGLMGAFGVALEVKKRIQTGLSKKTKYSLHELKNREVSYGKVFTCQGGAEKCDRQCEIMTIIINGKKYPFGGACNKYYNQRHKIQFENEKLDLVAYREKLVFEKYCPSKKIHTNVPSIGINRSFYVNSYYPLFYNFFTELGFNVILPDEALQHGQDNVQAPFCYPMLLAHGFFLELLQKKPDYIFLPHILQLNTEYLDKKEIGDKKTCIFNQCEPFVLKTTFAKKYDIPELLIPRLDFSRGVDSQKKEFIKIAQQLGKGRKHAIKAFNHACKFQNQMVDEFYAIGQKTLHELEKDPDRFAVVLFGRSYNSFTEKANLGIPHKFTSRGYEIIPYDFLDFANEKHAYHMHWGMGHTLLNAGELVAKHKQLFATFITNFSCGPDSFLIELFQESMEGKPALILELDSHSADAGINTRIEAFIDVVKFYRELIQQKKQQEEKPEPFKPARIVGKGLNAYIETTDGRRIHAKTPEYTFLFPSLSYYQVEAGIHYLKQEGIKGARVPETTFDNLKIGRNHTSCKECIPLAACVGNLLRYLNEIRKKDEVVVYLHATDTSPCRLEQYYNSFNRLIVNNRIKDFAIFRLDDRQGYTSVGTGLLLNLFKCFIIGDIFEQLRTSIRVLAKDPEYGLKIMDEEYSKIVENFAGNEKIPLYKRLKLSVRRLNKIERKKDIKDARFITLTGEIYVRNDYFLRKNIEQYLADKGFITLIVPFMEALFYIDYCLIHNLREVKTSIIDRVFFFVKTNIQKYFDKKIKKIFAKSGFYKYMPLDMKKIIKSSNFLVSPYMRGEIPIITGVALHYILEQSCGVISLGPFNCLPHRVSEALLKNSMNLDGKMKSLTKGTNQELDIDKPDPDVDKVEYIKKFTNNGMAYLPYLPIEIDGNPFTQVVEARLEVFCMQASRAYEKMAKIKADLN